MEKIERKTIKGLSKILIIMGILVFLYPLYTTLYSFYQQNLLEREITEIESAAQTVVEASADPLESHMEESPAIILPEQTDPSQAGAGTETGTGTGAGIGEQTEVPKQAVVLKNEPNKTQAFMRLEIPDINLSAVVVKGTSPQALKVGPGWYEQSALPGKGNTAIAGHKDMYGSWFRNIYRLQPGNLIYLSYQGRKYIYQVEKVFPIELNDWSVVAPSKEVKLTLTTCYTKTQRLACKAALKE